MMTKSNSKVLLTKDGIVMTLQGHLVTSHWRRLAALWDDTKSCGLSVVQLGEKCSATMWTLVAL